MTQYITTLNDIRKHSPCSDGWTKLMKHLGKTDPDDDPLDLLTILESNGLDDTLWCLRALPEQHDNAVRLLVCDLVEPAMQFVDDPQERPQKALKAARAFANGLIPREELDAAGAAGAAARDAAWAAARDAAGAAARVAAWAAAGAAAWAAGDAAGAAARVAAWAAARVAAWAAARVAQEETLRAWLTQ